MALIYVGDLKGTREALCAAQGSLNRSGMGDALNESQGLRIQEMINQIDILRPLGSDEEHGDHHTPYCGCEGVTQDYELEFMNDRRIQLALIYAGR